MRASAPQALPVRVSQAPLALALGLFALCGVCFPFYVSQLPARTAPSGPLPASIGIRGAFSNRPPRDSCCAKPFTTRNAPQRLQGRWPGPDKEGMMISPTSAACTGSIHPAAPSPMSNRPQRDGRAVLAISHGPRMPLRTKRLRVASSHEASSAANLPVQAKASPTPPVTTAPTSSGGGTDAKSILSNVPNILTIVRVALIPIFCVVFFAEHPAAGPASAGIFVAAALTDALDGFIARRFHLQSAFGAFLDPVADKLIVAAALILLCGKPPVVGPCMSYSWLLPVPSVAIIGREVAMSALREWAASTSPEAYKACEVNWMGKSKTALQMIAIALLLAVRDGAYWAGVAMEIAAVVGPALLYVAAVLSVLSLVSYWRKVAPYLIGPAK